MCILKCRYCHYDPVYAKFLKNFDFTKYPPYIPEDCGLNGGTNLSFFDHVDQYFWEVIVTEETLSFQKPLVSFLVY
jgi:hypothetical protein